MLYTVHYISAPSLPLPSSSPFNSPLSHSLAHFQCAPLDSTRHARTQSTLSLCLSKAQAFTPPSVLTEQLLPIECVIRSLLPFPSPNSLTYNRRRRRHVSFSSFLFLCLKSTSRLSSRRVQGTHIHRRSQLQQTTFHLSYQCECHKGINTQPPKERLPFSHWLSLAAVHWYLIPSPPGALVISPLSLSLLLLSDTSVERLLLSVV